MGALDDLNRYREVDPTGLGDRIVSSPAQCGDAWRKALAFPFPDPFRSIERVLVLGMGGSAIVGDLLAGLHAFHGGVPVEVHRGYGLGPADERTLIIASSYSGQTEETLSAFESAWKPGLNALAVTTGGRLAASCASKGVPVFPIEVQGEPRSACGWTLFGMLGALQRLGQAPDRSDDVAEAIEVLHRLKAEIEPSVPADSNSAKRLAVNLQGKVAVVCGAEHLLGVARRWKTQIEENAHGWAFFEELPEHNHNAIEGVRLPAAVADRMHHVFLESPLYHDRIRLRCTLTREMLQEGGLACERVESPGNGPLAQMMAGVLFGDYVSYYLAILEGVDPAETPNLNRLKAKMASG